MKAVMHLAFVSLLLVEHCLAGSTCKERGGVFSLDIRARSGLPFVA